jgi:hypothetical protein
MTAYACREHQHRQPRRRHPQTRADQLVQTLAAFHDNQTEIR